MTVPIDAAFAAAAGAAAYGELTLVELQAASGTVRLTTWPWDVDVMGHIWTGVGTLGRVSEMHEGDDGASEQIKLSLSPVPLDARAFALADPHEYRDRPVRVWVAMLDAATMQITGAPVLRFAGVMDQMDMPREGTTGTIGVTCRTMNYDVRSNPSSLRMNHVQHQRRHPGELGFTYLQGLVGNPSVWASKAFSAYMYIRNMLGFR